MISQEFTTNQPKKQTYSLKEIADLCGVTNETVRLWVASGKIAASRIAKTYVFKASDFDRFLEHHKVKAPSVL